MDIEAVPIITVSYNSAELIKDLLGSLRLHYSNPITVIDGSDGERVREIEAVCSDFKNVKFIHFDYNIHHGPGMAWSFNNLGLQGPILVLDSDIYILKRGFLEDLYSHLTADMYGVGHVNYVNEEGFDLNYKDGAIPYLHPACMLINLDVVLKWPMPIKHGAPMIEPMLALYRAGRTDLIKGVDWVSNDFMAKNENDYRIYLRHDWQGTVKRSGSYNLEKWSKQALESNKIRQHIFSLLPDGRGGVAEIGASDGLLRRLFKDSFPDRDYICVGSHIDKKDLENTKYYGDLNKLEACHIGHLPGIKTWILDGALEVVEDPDGMLSLVRNIMDVDANIIAIVPNSQHWSFQLRLLSGDLTYGDKGLLSNANRHLFSRSTLEDLFNKNELKINNIIPMSFNILRSDEVALAMKNLMARMGLNPITTYAEAQVDFFIINAGI
jgi:hypothetical protein